MSLLCTYRLLAAIAALFALAACEQPDARSSNTTTAQPTLPTASSEARPTSAPAAPLPTPRVEQIAISHYVTPKSLSERVAISDVIVIGQVTNTGEIINSARDTENPTKSATDMFNVGQVYHFEVQRYLEGAGSNILNVLQSEGMIFAAPETVTQADIDRVKTGSPAIPLSVGTTYLLFLKRLDGYGFEKEYYTAWREPWRYILAPDGSAQLEAPEDARRAIPPDFLLDPNAPLLPQVEQAIQAERATTP
jgi:hypothetical protein